MRNNQAEGQKMRQKRAIKPNGQMQQKKVERVKNREDRTNKRLLHMNVCESDRRFNGG